VPAYLNESRNLDRTSELLKGMHRIIGVFDVFGQSSKYDIIIVRSSLAYCEIGAQMRFVCVPNLHVSVYPTYSSDNLLLFAIVHLHLLDLTILSFIRGEHRPPQQCHSGLGY
jgi:hypothetical protein